MSDRSPVRMRDHGPRHYLALSSEQSWQSSALAVGSGDKYSNHLFDKKRFPTSIDWFWSSVRPWHPSFPISKLLTEQREGKCAYCIINLLDRCALIDQIVVLAFLESQVRVTIFLGLHISELHNGIKKHTPSLSSLCINLCTNGCFWKEGYSPSFDV